MERIPKAPCPIAAVLGIIVLLFGMVQANPGERAKTLHGNRREECESFRADGTEAGCAYTLARLSLYFCSGISQPLARSERGRFSFMMDSRRKNERKK